jgi:hypothetical protein
MPLCGVARRVSIKPKNLYALLVMRLKKSNNWIVTNYYDLSAEQIATVFKLRWDIENFFAWWKRQLKA